MGKSCVEMFEQFFDHEIVNYVVQESKKYAQFINQPDPKITKDEMRCLGILILSGYNSLPSKRMYWELREDTQNSLVCNAMRRNRFLQLQRFFHCADNNDMDPNDNAWKILPLVNRIREKCLRHFVPLENL
ncbi:hypothetical protein NQ314_005308 [Rhamnusium bicolor]|uniref:PiggyBac transposable element-derived protein domain-containing protein n=1 Tax=Rhamnusium bicolor TaxID=1586634 RepID=A0AAV8ZJ59_9CUCU|nr:hypothetical protein NQ314_005308 [Rhamnusium bicolor]